jgi:hypothetical protein
MVALGLDVPAFAPFTEVIPVGATAVTALDDDSVPTVSAAQAAARRKAGEIAARRESAEIRLSFFI